MKNKKLWIGAIALAVLVAVLLGAYFLTRPQGQEGLKKVTVSVIHKDGTQKDFPFETEEEFLGKLLVNEGIVEDNQTEYGLYILTADGETADWSVDEGWWAVYVGDEMAELGADSTVLTDGTTYKLVYTCG